MMLKNGLSPAWLQRLPPEIPSCSVRKQSSHHQHDSGSNQDYDQQQQTQCGQLVANAIVHAVKDNMNQRIPPRGLDQLTGANFAQ